mgnify:FL=1|tara:strand:+ start:214 stop:726 length:513 start_codon:yes stop_codon:yes gene_type:complete
MSEQLDHTSHQSRGVKFPLSIFIHDLKSPFNMGGIFRLADALGVESLLLSGETPKPPNRKVAKTARSTEKFVNALAVEDPVKSILSFKEDGYTIIALELCDNSEPLDTLVLPNNAKICLILGEESFGVNQELLDLADMICHIPMQGQNSSMNVVSACAIATYSLINKIGK